MSQRMSDSPWDQIQSCGTARFQRGVNFHGNLSYPVPPFMTPIHIRLSRTMRSVATGTQWSGPVKSIIVYELLPSRATESDSRSEPSQWTSTVSQLLGRQVERQQASRHAGRTTGRQTGRKIRTSCWVRSRALSLVLLPFPSYFCTACCSCVLNFSDS